MIKKVEPEFIKYKSITDSEAEYDGTNWKVVLKISITRVDKNGEESVAKYEVWSLNKDLEKAQATVQFSASAYFNTHNQEELYGKGDIQVTNL